MAEDHTTPNQLLKEAAQAFAEAAKARLTSDELFGITKAKLANAAAATRQPLITVSGRFARNMFLQHRADEFPSELKAWLTEQINQSINQYQGDQSVHRDLGDRPFDQHHGGASTSVAPTGRLPGSSAYRSLTADHDPFAVAGVAEGFTKNPVVDLHTVYGHREGPAATGPPPVFSSGYAQNPSRTNILPADDPAWEGLNEKPVILHSDSYQNYQANMEARFGRGGVPKPPERGAADRSLQRTEPGHAKSANPKDLPANIGPGLQAASAAAARLGLQSGPAANLDRGLQSSGPSRAEQSHHQTAASRPAAAQPQALPAGMDPRLAATRLPTWLDPQLFAGVNDVNWFLARIDAHPGPNAVTPRLNATNLSIMPAEFDPRMFGRMGKWADFLVASLAQAIYHRSGGNVEGGGQAGSSRDEMELT